MKRKILKLTFQKLSSIRLGVMPSIMLLFMTIRTLLGGDAIMLSGLCVSFIPFFATVKVTGQQTEGITEREAICSDYWMQFIACTIGLLYLKGLTIIGSLYNPYYVPSDYTQEMFWFCWICNYGFMSITVPVAYALNQGQRLTMAILLANIEIAAMVLIHNFLVLCNGAFVLENQWGIAVLAALMPVFGIGTVCLKDRKEKSKESRM